MLVAHREGLFAKEGLEIEFVKGSERYAVVKTDRNVTNPDGLSSRLGHGSGHASGAAMMYNACEWGNYRRVQDS
ncbi:MAG: ABC transporter substrate-binding protein, partial [candidate division NC10 bacterium]